MKTDNAGIFLRAAALFAVAAFGGNILTQAQSCNVEWTGNAGNGSWSTAGNWSTHKVPGPTSDVCILNGTADGAGLNGSSRSISVHSIQVGEFASLLFGSGTVSTATSLTNNGFVTLFGTKLSAASIDVPGSGGAPAPGARSTRMTAAPSQAPRSRTTVPSLLAPGGRCDSQTIRSNYKMEP